MTERDERVYVLAQDIARIRAAEEVLRSLDTDASHIKSKVAESLRCLIAARNYLHDAIRAGTA